MEQLKQRDKPPKTKRKFCPKSAGGLRETYVCDLLSSGFGASVLAFFGERGTVPVGHGGGPEWSGMGRLGDVGLGTWRSVRAC
jgi:hypothetical protein